MSLTPLSIRKMRFRQKLRGYDPVEVEEYLEVMADELARALTDAEQQSHRGQALAERLARTEDRERNLQDTLLRAQRVSEEILASSQREAQLLVREAELTADRIVQQAVDQAQRIERKISELRLRRRELQAKLKSTIDLFARTVEAEMAEEDPPLASLHAIPRSPRKSLESS